MAGRIHHDFHHVRIRERCHVVYRVARRRHISASQPLGKLSDQLRLDEGFIALHVDHDVLVAQAKLGDGKSPHLQDEVQGILMLDPNDRVKGTSLDLNTIRALAASANGR